MAGHVSGQGSYAYPLPPPPPTLRPTPHSCISSTAPPSIHCLSPPLVHTLPQSSPPPYTASVLPWFSVLSLTHLLIEGRRPRCVVGHVSGHGSHEPCTHPPPPHPSPTPTPTPPPPLMGATTPTHMAASAPPPPPQTASSPCSAPYRSLTRSLPHVPLTRSLPHVLYSCMQAGQETPRCHTPKLPALPSHHTGTPAAETRKVANPAARPAPPAPGQSALGSSRTLKSASLPHPPALAHSTSGQGGGSQPSRLSIFKTKADLQVDSSSPRPVVAAQPSSPQTDTSGRHGLFSHAARVADACQSGMSSPRSPLSMALFSGTTSPAAAGSASHKSSASPLSSALSSLRGKRA